MSSVLWLSLFFLSISLILVASTWGEEGGIISDPDQDIPIFGYEIVNSYPHDPTAFTQGLVYDRDGVLYEGTGLYGQSSLRRVDLETGRVLQQISLQSNLFGEGIALWEESIVQLTWQSRMGLVYHKENLTEMGRFGYQTEGWGITSNNQSLIMSDGSSILHILDPETFRERGQMNVTYRGRPLMGLNELEYIKGEIFANVWPTSRIVIISPVNGTVMGEIDLTGILPQNETAGRMVDVLNGIAYDAESDRIFVTGKLWPRLYQIRLVMKNI